MGMKQVASVAKWALVAKMASAMATSVLGHEDGQPGSNEITEATIANFEAEHDKLVALLQEAECCDGKGKLKASELAKCMKEQIQCEIEKVQERIRRAQEVLQLRVMKLALIAEREKLLQGVEEGICAEDVPDMSECLREFHDHAQRELKKAELEDLDRQISCIGSRIRGLTVHIVFTFTEI